MPIQICPYCGGPCDRDDEYAYSARLRRSVKVINRWRCTRCGEFVTLAALRHSIPPPTPAAYHAALEILVPHLPGPRAKAKANAKAKAEAKAKAKKAKAKAKQAKLAKTKRKPKKMTPEAKAKFEAARARLVAKYGPGVLD
jgi:hypothetical protein